jgi:hypothetical protein
MGGMNSFSYDTMVPMHSLQDGPSTGHPSGPPVLPDTVNILYTLPAGAEEMFNQGIEAANKLAKQAVALASTIPLSCTSHYSELKEKVKMMVVQKTQLEHIVNFRELQDGTVPDRVKCNDIIGNFAELVSAVNVSVEICKGVVKAFKAPGAAGFLT